MLTMPVAGSTRRDSVSTAITCELCLFHGQYLTQLAVETSSQEYSKSCVEEKTFMVCVSCASVVEFGFVADNSSANVSFSFCTCGEAAAGGNNQRPIERVTAREADIEECTRKAFKRGVACEESKCVIMKGAKMGEEKAKVYASHTAIGDGIPAVGLVQPAGL